MNEMGEGYAHWHTVPSHVWVNVRNAYMVFQDSKGASWIESAPGAYVKLGTLPPGCQWTIRKVELHEIE